MANETHRIVVASLARRARRAGARARVAFADDANSRSHEDFEFANALRLSEVAQCDGKASSMAFASALSDDARASREALRDDDATRASTWSVERCAHATWRASAMSNAAFVERVNTRERTQGRDANDEETCAVCLEARDGTAEDVDASSRASEASTTSHGVVRIVACAHTFHFACLSSWLRYNSTCPMCRTVVRSSPAASRGGE